MVFKIENDVLVKYIDLEEKIVKEVAVPNGIVSIADWAFFPCMRFESVIIPDSVTNIGSFAFNDCSGLTSISFPNSVKTIGKGAFAECSGLKSADIPDGVEYIGDKAFEKCRALKSAVLPNSITYLGESAFYGCNDCIFTIKADNAAIKLKLPKSSIPDYDDDDNNGLYKFIAEKNHEKREDIFGKIKKEQIKIPLGVFLTFEHDSEIGKDYIKNNIEKVVEYLIDLEDIANITKILLLGYITEKNIDEILNYSSSGNKNPEIMGIIEKYRNDRFDKEMV